MFVPLGRMACGGFFVLEVNVRFSIVMSSPLGEMIVGNPLTSAVQRMTGLEPDP